MKSFTKISVLLLMISIFLVPLVYKVDVRAEILDTDVVLFEDANLEAAVRSKIKKSTGDITVLDIKNMTGDLTATNMSIRSLKGLEHAVNLTRIELSGNEIVDLTPLSNMTKLEYIFVGNNKIKCLEPLKNMHSLEMLVADNNYISDLSPLSELASLTNLKVSDNNISDLTPVAKIEQLGLLWVGNNNIKDISCLKDLQIGSLHLSGNPIENFDIISSYNYLMELMIDECDVEDISFLKNSNNLMYFSAIGNRISDISALSNKPMLMLLRLDDNKIKDISPILTSPNLSYFTISNNLLEGTLPEDLKNINCIASPEDYKEINFAFNNLIGPIPTEIKTNLKEGALYGNFIEGESNQKQLVLNSDTSLELNLSSIPTQGSLKNLVKVLYDGTENLPEGLRLELVPVDQSFFDESGKAIKSGTTSAYIKIVGASDSNTYAKTLEAITVTISDKLGSNNDIRIDFSLRNSLEVTLEHNYISFGNVSSVGGEEAITSLTISSSLPYSISSIAYGDFIGESNVDNIIPIEKISLKYDLADYQPLSLKKVSGINDAPAGIDIKHNLVFKMGSTLGYKKDTYKSTLNIIVDTR